MSNIWRRRSWTQMLIFLDELNVVGCFRIFFSFKSFKINQETRYKSSSVSCTILGAMANRDYIFFLPFPCCTLSHVGLILRLTSSFTFVSPFPGPDSSRWGEGSKLQPQGPWSVSASFHRVSQGRNSVTSTPSSFWEAMTTGRTGYTAWICDSLNCWQ